MTISFFWTLEIYKDHHPQISKDSETITDLNNCPWAVIDSQPGRHWCQPVGAFLGYTTSIALHSEGYLSKSALVCSFLATDSGYS